MPMTPENVVESATLKRLFEEKATISQKEFAKRFDIGTPGLLWQYLNGRKALNLKVAVKIAAGLGVCVGDFSPRLSKEQRDLAPSNVAPLPVRQKKIPILSSVRAGDPNGGAVSARETAIEEGDYVMGDFEMPDECFALVIEGRSMEPDFREGDVIIVDPTVAPAPGDFVVASREDPIADGFETTFKKYRPRGYSPSGRVIFELTPLNPDFPTYNSEVDKLSIVGVLVEHRRKYRHY